MPTASARQGTPVGSAFSGVAVSAFTLDNGAKEDLNDATTSSGWRFSSQSLALVHQRKAAIRT
jgi:hypothetical protein